MDVERIKQSLEFAKIQLEKAKAALDKAENDIISLNKNITDAQLAMDAIQFDHGIMEETIGER